MTTDVRPAAKADDKPKAPLVQDSYETYFLVPQGGAEFSIAREYLKKMYPTSEGRLTTEIPLDRLTDRNTVIVLLRTEGTAAEAVILNPTAGNSSIRRLPHKELAEEVVESDPIACKAFWTKGGRFNDGVVDVASFLEALGKAASPLAVKLREDVRSIWLAPG